MNGQTDVEALIGQSAGHICYTNLDPDSFYVRAVMDAAETIWERGMSAWSLVNWWDDGTTIWHSPAGEAVATVMPDGTVHIE